MAQQQPLPERSELLEERLAKAAALPPDQRSPEVAAFIETAALHAEAAELVAQRQPRLVAARRQHSLLFSLKFVRAHCLSPVQSVLVFRPAAITAAVSRLAELLPVDPASNACGAAINALLQRDSSLDTLLRVAAGVRLYSLEIDDAGLMQMASGVVRRLQQPAEAERVRRELAAAQAQLPSPLVSFEQLLAFFVGLAWQHAIKLYPGSGSSLQQAMKTVCQDYTTLVPRLEPHNCCHQFLAAMGASLAPGQLMAALHQQLLTVLQLAEQSGCDLAAAMAGYQIVTNLQPWASQDLPGLQAACTPSDALAWLAQARVAHHRAMALLSSQWTATLPARKATAAYIQPWLVQLQQAGNRWAPMEGAQKAAWRPAAPQYITEREEDSGAAITCDACSISRSVRYCSPQCQRAHWPEHRAACKAAAAARARRQQAAD